MTENEKVLLECEQRSKSNSHRIDGLEKDMKEMKEDNKAIYKIATSVEVMAEKLGNIEEKVDETNRKVDETAKAQRISEDRFLQRVADIEGQPAIQLQKNVNEIKVKVITAIITFLVTGALGALIYFAK
ncbi:MAG: hypothetical protein Q4C12_00200 [Clostridia bacterium]|nr:hypothetical protein [Clostridia bacterium]